MDRNFIASELLKAAEEMTARREDVWEHMPHRAGNWARNIIRRDDEKILEYVSSMGGTVLLENKGHAFSWDLLDADDELVDAGTIRNDPNQVDKLLKMLSRRYTAKRMPKRMPKRMRKAAQATARQGKL